MYLSKMSIPNPQVIYSKYWQNEFSHVKASVDIETIFACFIVDLNKICDTNEV